MQRMIFLILVLVLTGCASFSEQHSRTLLMDRRTGDMEECTVDKWRSAGSYEKYRQCIVSFQQRGYSIWSQY